MIKKLKLMKLSRKIDIFSNDVNRIRKHKNYLKLILKGGLEEQINALLYKYDIKREVFFDGKLNGVNCRRLMKHRI